MRSVNHSTPHADRPEPAVLDDLVVGASCDLGSAAVGEADIIAFAEQFDPQPFHCDPAAAQQSATKGLIASGWHTASLAMRLIALGKPFGISPILGIGVDELRWPVPVRPGDSVHAQAQILAVRPSASKLDRGMVQLLVELRNAGGEIVFSMKPMMVVPRRAGA